MKTVSLLKGGVSQRTQEMLYYFLAGAKGGEGGGEGFLSDNKGGDAGGVRYFPEEGLLDVFSFFSLSLPSSSSPKIFLAFVKGVWGEISSNP